MKEVININLSGRVLAIEKDAADGLKSYLDSLRNHFNAEEGSEEIMADIEFRIAELLYNELNSGKVAINLADVEDVKKKMGLAEELSEEEEANQSAHFTTKRRLTKNTSNKMIGGVCSGVASFFAIDATVVRIVWAILALSGGLGFLIYIALWIFLPESDEPVLSNRKLFRDMDNAWISGVCAGLAKYMKVDVWIPRLIFGLPVAASLLGGIGFSIFSGIPFIGFSFNGGLILIYIILSYVIPKAVTDFDKMDMEGEVVNLESIKNRFNEQMGQTKEMFNSASANAKRSIDQIKKHRPIRTFFHIVGVFLLVMFLIFATLIGAYVVGNYDQIHMFTQWIDLSATQQNLFVALVCVFATMIVLGIALLLTARMRVKGLRPGLGAGLFLSIVAFVVLGVSAAFATVKQYRTHYTEKNQSEIIIPRGGELVLKDVGEKEWDLDDDDLGISGLNVYHMDADSFTYRNVHCTVYPSKDTFVRIEVNKHARGKSKAQAMKRVKSFDFNYTMDGSNLYVPATSTLYKPQKFGMQHVELKIYAPKGTRVVDELEHTYVRFKKKENKRRREWVVESN